LVPTFYKGTSQWKNQNKGSWRDSHSLESTINSRPLSVICVKKKINGNSETCEDLNECEIGYCGYGTCSNSEGSFSCTCPDNFDQGDGNNQCKECKNGFELDAERCRDINECDVMDCGQGECKNNPGSYSCNCFEGAYNLYNDSSLLCGNFPIINIAVFTQGCTISLINDTAVVYETEDPYHDNDKCNVDFSCPNGQVLRYSIQRFEIEKHSLCKYDSLVLNGVHYCSGNNKEPEMDGILSSGKVSFSSDYSEEYAGFSMIIQCAEVTEST